MNISFVIYHPAQVHKFAYLIKKLEKEHNIFVGAVNKEITKYLLDFYSIDYYLLGKNRKNKLAKIFFFLKQEIVYFLQMLKFKPDLLIGSGDPLMAHISFLLKKPYIVFDDSEHNKIILRTYLPFATKILTPDCFMMDLGEKHIKYKGYHELAYLHPNYFSPDKNVLSKLGLKPNEKYYLIRKTAGTSVENIGQTLMKDDDIIKIINKLEKHGRVFLSYEGNINNELKKYLIKIKPEDMHSVLYYANMIIGDTLTMFTEAAILGTPAISISSEGFELGNFNDICEKYKLGFRFRTLPEAFNTIDNLLKKENLKVEWQNRRKKLLEDKIDVTQYWFDYIQEFMKENIKEG